LTLEAARHILLARRVWYERSLIIKVMLTRKQILKVTRLLDQTGEARSGFLHDGQANLRGQNTSTARSAFPGVRPRHKKTPAEKRVVVRLSYQSDPKTGEPRLTAR
jgi:outer membrane protein assembly factor BamD (BamD/ComL family)